VQLHLLQVLALLQFLYVRQRHQQALERVTVLLLPRKHGVWVERRLLLLRRRCC
jgi:hypothetical protein